MNTQTEDVCGISMSRLRSLGFEQSAPPLSALLLGPIFVLVEAQRSRDKCALKLFILCALLLTIKISFLSSLQLLTVFSVLCLKEDHVVLRAKVKLDKTKSMNKYAGKT